MGKGTFDEALLRIDWSKLIAYGKSPQITLLLLTTVPVEWDWTDEMALGFNRN